MSEAVKRWSGRVFQSKILGNMHRSGNCECCPIYMDACGLVGICETQTCCCLWCVDGSLHDADLCWKRIKKEEKAK